MSETGSWQDDVFQALKRSKIRHVAYVPDAGHTRLINAAHVDPDMVATVLTTEEEGIGVLAGADLGGERGVMLMQSSGVGNCINTFTLLQNCGFPFLTLVTMRGEWAEFVPWQVPMGQTTQKVLELSGLIVQRCERPEEAGETVEAAAILAFDGYQRVAVLLAQKLIGAKKF